MSFWDGLADLFVPNRVFTKEAVHAFETADLRDRGIISQEEAESRVKNHWRTTQREAWQAAAVIAPVAAGGALVGAGVVPFATAEKIVGGGVALYSASQGDFSAAANFVGDIAEVDTSGIREALAPLGGLAPKSTVPGRIPAPSGPNTWNVTGGEILPDLGGGGATGLFLLGAGALGLIFLMKRRR